MARVLLIEPDKNLSDIYAAALKKDNHQVLVVQGAQTAIHAADKIQPDIVLLDVQMAAHNGVEFLYELRSYEDMQTVPVIVVTGLSAEKFDMSEALRKQLGVQKIVRKAGVSLKSLCQLVRTHSLEVAA